MSNSQGPYAQSDDNYYDASSIEWLSNVLQSLSTGIPFVNYGYPSTYTPYLNSNYEGQYNAGYNENANQQYDLNYAQPQVYGYQNYQDVYPQNWNYQTSHGISGYDYNNADSLHEPRIIQTYAATISTPNSPYQVKHKTVVTPENPTGTGYVSVKGPGISENKTGKDGVVYYRF